MANRLSRKLQLRPPVDVSSLASQFASIKQKSFPVRVDGVCLNLKKIGVRPEIWINRELSPQRKRFTLAHEIGHIVIPWHIGLIVDDLDVGDADGDDEYRTMEAEANRFAAELLMPKDWSVSICNRSEHLVDAIHAIKTIAEVSVHAANLRALQSGPEGYIYAMVENGIIIQSGRTKGTKSLSPKVGGLLASIEMPSYEAPKIIRSGALAYYWWQRRNRIVAPSKPADPWRSIMERMLETVPEYQRKKIQMSMNSIVGYTLGGLPPGSPVEDVFQRLLDTLQNRQFELPGASIIRRHPEFLDYVAARAYERAEAAIP